MASERSLKLNDLFILKRPSFCFVILLLVILLLVRAQRTVNLKTCLQGKSATFQTYQQHARQISNILRVSATFQAYQQHSKPISNIPSISATFMGMLLIFLSATLSATWMYPDSPEVLRRYLMFSSQLF